MPRGAISWANAGFGSARASALAGEGSLRCRAVPCSAWGGGGSLRQSSLDCVFINHPLKKYPTHRPGYLAPIKSLYSLRSCITFLYSLRSVVMIPFSFGYLNSLAPTGTGSSLRLGLLKEYK